MLDDGGWGGCRWCVVVALVGLCLMVMVLMLVAVVVTVVVVGIRWRWCSGVDCGGCSGDGIVVVVVVAVVVFLLVWQQPQRYSVTAVRK